MEPSVEDLVRCDRVGLYNRYGPWLFMPLQGPTYGDLWLTRDGKLGFAGVGWSGDSWDMSLSDVSRVARVSLSIFPWCAQLWPSTSLEADFADKRRLVYFTGITRFMSKADRLISHIPGVHHAGAAVVGLKSMAQNRGSKDRAKDILETWLKILDGSTPVHLLARLVDA